MYLSLYPEIYEFIKNTRNTEERKLKYIAIHHYLSTFIISTKDRYASSPNTLSCMKKVQSINGYLDEIYKSKTRCEIEDTLKNIYKKDENSNQKSIIKVLAIFVPPLVVQLNQFSDYVVILSDANSYGLISSLYDITTGFQNESNRYYGFWQAKYLRPLVTEMLFQKFGDVFTIILDYTYVEIGGLQLN